jgi:hypothetical protein
MIMTDGSPNYPDILGYITGDVQMTFGVVQAALAVSPSVVFTGHPFEIILLLQNLSDVHVKVVASLRLPPVDAAGKKHAISSHHHRRTVTLHPAEVGYLVMPAAISPAAAPASAYSLSMSLEVEPTAKPRRIRAVGSKDEINLDYYFYLSEQTITRLVRLKGLGFSATGSRLIGGSSIETTFSVIPGQPVPLPPSKVSWVRLWSLNTHSDTRPLLERYHTALLEQVIPHLKRDHLFPLLQRALRERFSMHYPMQAAELHFAAKLLVHVLEMAAQPPERLYYPQQSIYAVSQLLLRGWPRDGSPIVLPNWTRAALTHMGVDPLVTDNPLAALTTILFDDLLRDSILHGFRLIHAITGQQLGSDSDARAYGEQLIQLLADPTSRLSFLDCYLPLIIGGVLVAHDTTLHGESVLESLNALEYSFRTRASEQDADNTEIFDLFEKCVDEEVRRYRGWI